MYLAKFLSARDSDPQAEGDHVTTGDNMARPYLGTVALASAGIAGFVVLALLANTAPALAVATSGFGAGLAGTRLGRPGPIVHDEQIAYQRWSSFPDWRTGSLQGTVPLPGARTGITMLRPAGTASFTDPHTGITKDWE